MVWSADPALTADVAWPAISAAKLRSTRRLLSAKGRQSVGAFLAEGPQAVREALAWGGLRRIMVGPEPTAVAAQLAEAAARQGVPVAAVGGDDMALITDTVHGQGIVGVCGRPSLSLGDIVRHRLVLILDEVRDPGNVGTLIRTADAFGVDAVITTSGTAEPWAPKAVRASVGSVFHLPIITGVGFQQVVGWASHQGLKLLAADSSGWPLDEPNVVDLLSGTVAWIVGNEAAGLPPEHLAAADETVAVPMRGRAESLNVAAAAAICLYTTAVAQDK